MNLFNKLTNWVLKVPAFLKLIRWPNLLIILIIQPALYLVIIRRFYAEAGVSSSFFNLNLLLLVFATLVVAAAGYIINDYFDLRVDRINKPESMVLGRRLDRRTGIVLHQVLNIIAVVIGFYLAYKVGSWRLGLIFPMIIILLWLYSVKYKRTVIWGNIAIASMSALVIVIVWLFEFFMLRQQPDNFITVAPYLGSITRYFGLFAAFAFLLTFIREVIKDAEDIDGDKTTGIITLAVKYGINSSKKVAMAVTTVTAAFMFYIIIVFIMKGMVIPGAYFGLTVLIPLAYLVFRIAKASEKGDFHTLSTLIKIIMIAGILGLQPLSMVIG